MSLLLIPVFYGFMVVTLALALKLGFYIGGVE